MNSVFLLLALLIGYYLGREQYNNDIKVVGKRLSKAKTIITGKTRTANIIQRPTAQQLKKLTKEQQGEKEAFDETLGELPEIRKAKSEIERR